MILQEPEKRAFFSMSKLINAFDNVEPRESSKVAALDIGSNSFHLVVARIVAGDVQILHRVKERVRLAEGLDKDGILSQEAIQRGLSVLAVIAESLQGFKPDSVRIVATYTLRKAKNAKEFIKAARSILPYPIEVIPGSEEARLIYSGVAHTNQDEGQRLVIDIGGGSTEFIIGKGYRPLALSSLQMGCVSYTKKFFKQGDLKPQAFAKAITSAQQELERIDSRYIRLGWTGIIGTSGTIKIIVALAQQIEGSSQDGKVTLKDLEQLIAGCCEAGHCDNLRFEGMTEDRRPVFAAGLAILTAAFKSLHIDQLEYSPSALREGVIYEMENQLTHPDIRERSAESLATRYDVDIEHAKRVLSTTTLLHSSCKQKWDLKSKECSSMLGWAALLHEVGLQINSRGVQRHSAYILQNIELQGFNQEQQNLLSTLARFHRKKIRLADVPEFSQFDNKQVYRMIALLRLAVLFNIKRQDGIIPDLKIKCEGNQLALMFPKDWLSQKPIFTADLEQESEQLKVLGLEVLYQ